MKSFYISLTLFAIMLGGIVANFAYINRTADKLTEMVDALPALSDPTCQEASQDVCDFWLEQADLVALSVSYTVVDRVSEQAALLVGCAACHDIYGYQTALSLLKDAIGDMRRLERFSIGNLL